MKIKEYLSKHPKLIRVLKVLATFGITFSIGFNVLIIVIGSLSLHNSNEHEVKAFNEPITTSPIYNEIELSGYDLYVACATDITNNDFIQTLLDRSNWQNLMYGNPKPSYYDFNFDCKIIKQADLNLNDLNASSVWQDISYIRFFYDTQVSLNSTYEAYVFTLQFCTDANTLGLEFKLYIGVIPSQYDGTLNQFYYLYDNNNYNNFYMFYNRNNSTCFDYFNTDNNLSDYYDRGYQEGYYSGFEVGYDAGYNNGYVAGFNNTDNSPFGLISSAFYSLTSILNIQVLPNLTLGTLIFTPFIITIVIVVVKMFRG